MFDEEITQAVKVLFTVSALLTKIKHRLSEYEKSGLIGIDTARYLDLIIKNERRSVQSEVSELNSTNDCNVLPAEKEQDMNLNIPGISINSRPRKDGRWQGQILHDGARYYVYGKTREIVANKIKFYLQHGLPRPKKRKSTNVYGAP